MLTLIRIGALVAILLASTGLPLLAQPSGASAEVVAKNLAENVLGEQTVKQVKVSSDGRQIDITWESATYKASNSRETIRDLLKTEAELAGGAIMGVMRPTALRFVIFLGQKTLASGEMTNSGGFSITYHPDLRGYAFARLELN